MKALFRSLYGIIPFKRQLFTVLRSVWTPSESVWQHFYFEGKFNFNVNGKKVWLQNHNSLMETAIFWTHTYVDEKTSLALWNKLCEKSDHIYDIGGYDDSIGLGISIHEVVSTEEDDGALIENNRFADIHDGKWGGADVPGMGVFTHEQTTM